MTDWKNIFAVTEVLGDGRLFPAYVSLNVENPHESSRPEEDRHERIELMLRGRSRFGGAPGDYAQMTLSREELAKLAHAITAFLEGNC